MCKILWKNSLISWCNDVFTLLCKPPHSFDCTNHCTNVVWCKPLVTMFESSGRMAFPRYCLCHILFPFVQRSFWYPVPVQKATPSSFCCILMDSNGSEVSQWAEKTEENGIARCNCWKYTLFCIRMWIFGIINHNL